MKIGEKIKDAELGLLSCGYKNLSQILMAHINKLGVGFNSLKVDLYFSDPLDQIFSAATKKGLRWQAAPESQ
jgi:hypothetical protein